MALVQVSRDATSAVLLAGQTVCLRGGGQMGIIFVNVKSWTLATELTGDQLAVSPCTPLEISHCLSAFRVPT